MGKNATTDDLIADFFQAEVTDGDQDPEWVRSELLRHIDECIDVAKNLDLLAQNIAHGVFGTLAMGGMAISGVWDKDGAEVFRWLRERVEGMDAEDLELVEFDG